MQILRVLAAAFFVGVLGSAAALAQPQPKTSLRVAALFSESGDVIKSGVQWRVFAVRGTETGDLPEIAQSTDAGPTFFLEPGVYIVHAAYGMAAATRRVEVDARALSEKLVLNAGALKISGIIADQPLPPEKLTSRIYALLPGGGRSLIAKNVPSADPVRLPEGRYFIENSYGDVNIDGSYGGTNAIVTAEISIKAGQMTEAVFHHRAATLTFKLVSQPGGEAIANTIWLIQTNPAGDEVRRDIGAFPSIILAEGSYSLTARHDDRIYQRDFEVKPGFDQDIEVVAK